MRKQHVAGTAAETLTLVLLYVQKAGHGEESGGAEGCVKDMNQMDERQLSLALIDPFAPGMIQNSFRHFCPSLFDTS